MRFVAIALAVMLGGSCLPRSAAAQWVYDQGEDDPFAGGVTHMAITASNLGELIVFRCTGASDISLLYVSIEKPDPAHKSVVGIVPMQLHVIVDDEPKREFDAKIDVTPDGDKYRVTAEDADLADLVTLVAKAKRRFAVAVMMGGIRMYSAAVGVRGSRAAIGKLAVGCKLP